MFDATNSNAVISKSKNIFYFFAAFPESTKNLEYFEKNDEPESWFLSDIIDCKKHDYLNP